MLNDLVQLEARVLLARIDDLAPLWIFIAIQLTALHVLQPPIARNLINRKPLRWFWVQHSKEHLAKSWWVDGLVECFHVRIVDVSHLAAFLMLGFPFGPTTHEGLVVLVIGLANFSTVPDASAEDDINHHYGTAPDIKTAWIVLT